MIPSHEALWISVGASRTVGLGVGSPSELQVQFIAGPRNQRRKETQVYH